MGAFISFENVSYTIRPNSALRVGRAIDCDVRLIADPRVSRAHCLISNNNKVVTIADVGSKHGTTVNGVAVTSHPRVLEEGDLILIGDSQLVFHQYDDDDASEETVSLRRK